MKLFLIVVINIAFACVGYFIFDNYRRKKKFYSDMVDFCGYLSNEIRFNKNDIRKIFLSLQGRFNSELEGYLQAFLNYSTYNQKLLNSVENDEIIAFLKSLGKFDVDGEIKNINKYQELFTKKLNNASEQERTRGSAIFKIFIILGLLVSIIIF